MDTNKMREQFEAAVIARLKESGFLEVEIRVECLARSGDGYQDGSVDAYWHFWKASREAVVVNLPCDVSGGLYRLALEDCTRCIEAQGLRVTP